MIRSLWIARTGLEAQQTQLDVISNNLANVSTNGFKRARAVFEDLLYQNLRQPGAQSTQQTTIPSGLQIGTGVRPIATERIHTQGNLTQTGNALDVAIQGEGFFQILTPTAPPPTPATAPSRKTPTARSSPPAATRCSRPSPSPPTPCRSPSARTAWCR
jgi:flagellar hook-basal body protein